MLQTSTLDFLKQLSANNHRDWFMANKKAFEAAKKDFESFIQEIINGLGTFDEGVKDLKAKECVFRIYRDVRFSKDKSPYKTNFGAGMSKGGKKMSLAGYYLHLEPGGKSFLAGGIYMPEPTLLNAVRQEIDYNTEEFVKILEDKDFKKHFGKLSDIKLKTAPKQYPKDHPYIELLKHTSFIGECQLKDEVFTCKDAVQKIVTTFKALHPLNTFLNRVATDVSAKA
ncbi:MAG: DUF2461 domain-containing protein [Chitinophagales bacterium]|nr:DUF2461 domain-containing protein [Chitinophagales bacterium]